MKMEAEGTSEMIVPTYEITDYIPADDKLHIHFRENVRVAQYESCEYTNAADFIADDKKQHCLAYLFQVVNTAI